MIAHIKQLLEARPFVPFHVVMSSGQRYRVASPEHAGTNPKGTGIVVWFDDDSSVTLSALHISLVEKEAAQPA
jgi:hypothetical protein